MSETADIENPARYALFKALFLPSEGMSRASVDELLDAYAHELAEEIREERDAMRKEGEDPRIGVTQDMLNGMGYAADMIDPHPVRPDEEPTT
ncbi:hypothetical protein [Streptomyces sp. F-1]|uniref:hypothetical protein n=1 Tax=Streptomyces sp. F-1 TaxID=463642 RepID=UPI00085C0480|nr:hypothetical protein [Streptomyces sp. F-1]SFY52066.1 hypothetical protein STEPF1_05335 [Streptomyces sp. F-1]